MRACDAEKKATDEFAMLTGIGRRDLSCLPECLAGVRNPERLCVSQFKTKRAPSISLGQLKFSRYEEVDLTGQTQAILNYVLAGLGAGGTYAMMLLEAKHAGQWTHIVTLTPLLPYLVAAALTFRHRSRPRHCAAILPAIVVTIGVGWPLFWWYYVPEDTRPAVRVGVKIVAPILQAVLVIAIGVALEFLLARSQSKSRDSLDSSAQQHEEATPDRLRPTSY